MRILHVLSSLVPHGAAAVSRLIDEQRMEGHVVAVASVQVFGNAAGIEQFVDRTLGGAATFEVIHAHGTASVPVALTVRDAGHTRTPVVATLHDWVYDEGIRAAQPDIPSLTVADLVTAPSPLAASLVTRLGVQPELVRVIPYAVDATPRLTTEESALDRELVGWRTHGGDVLCAVGGPVGTHHEAVLTALTYVSQRDGLLCILAGQVDPDACADLAMRLGIDDRVRVCGPRVHPRTIAARCDYLALPAFDERRPFALVEAWCDGIPVIAGRNDVFAGMDSDGNGTVFFDAHDPLDLARAIATVRSTTPSARRLLVERARAQYRAHFTPRAVYAAYMTEYEAMRKRSGSPTARSAGRRLHAW